MRKIENATKEGQKGRLLLTEVSGDKTFETTQLVLC